MQTDLQVLLLIVGVVFSLYVIFSLFRRNTRKNKRESEEFGETVLARKPVAKDRDPLLEDAGIASSARVASTSQFTQEIDHFADHQQYQQEEPQEMIDQPQPASYIAITVLAKNPNGLFGNAIQNALKANHFQYHKQGVFNRHINDNPTMPVMFSVLSLREPGIFDIATMDTQIFEGIVLLLVLHGNNNPSATFEKMLTSARQLAVTLDGELCDDRRQPLTAHTMARIRERIQESHRRSLTR